MTEYEPTPHSTLRQGDIILAPAVLLVPPPEVVPALAAAPQRLGVPTRGALWYTGSGPAPTAAIEAQWAPSMVLSHDCELEKEFNERVDELVAGGMSEDEAVRRASADPLLDPYAVVAPLLPYAAFSVERHAGIRAGQRIGCLPVDRLPGDGGDYVVDLFRPCTISVQLLPQRAKVASLAPSSVYELRYKISEAYSSRDLAALVELEALVGSRITAIEALPKSKRKTSLVLHLDAQPPMHLEIRSPRENLPREIERLPPAAP